MIFNIRSRTIKTSNNQVESVTIFVAFLGKQTTKINELKIERGSEEKAKERMRENCTLKLKLNGDV